MSHGILASEDELVVPDVDIRPLTAIFSRQQFVDSLVMEQLRPYIFLGTLAGGNRGQQFSTEKHSPSLDFFSTSCFPYSPLFSSAPNFFKLW